VRSEPNERTAAEIMRLRERAEQQREAAEQEAA
jgi:hypothetical protein